MKILSFAFLTILTFSSCNQVEEINPLESITSGSQDDDGDSKEADIPVQYMELVNNHRISLGLKSLILESGLSDVARAHSVNMALGKISFGHTGFSERCASARVIMGSGNLCGEIVANGQSTYQAAFNSWMNSSGHRSKIEEPRYTHTGFGYAKSNSGTYYWTQVFLEVD